MRNRVLPVLLALPALLALDCPSTGPAGPEIPGLIAPARVITDAKGIPHVYAENDTDMARVQGYVHARERFFQMDVTRRQIDGTEAELFGADAIDGDIQMRLFGLSRAAERSLAALEPRELEVLEAYAVGVNAYLDAIRAGTAPLPDEYTALELTAASLADWSALDVLKIGKGIAASLSLDIDAGLDSTLQAYCDAGAAHQPPFDGARLLFDDASRFAPMDPASTLPDAGAPPPYLPGPDAPIQCSDLMVPASALHSLRERLSQSPFLAAAMDRDEFQIGSNEWGVSSAASLGSFPMIANDPHLSLDNPSTFYENHLIVSDDPVEGPMNVSGVSFPGTPFVILGQNTHITWGATTTGFDVTDLFVDRIVKSDPNCVDESGVRQTFCIVSGGELHHMEVETVVYMQNTPGDGVMDNLEIAPVGLDSGALILTVPFRSDGPMIPIPGVTDFGIFFGGAVTETLVWVAQFTGFHATREVQTFRIWNRAKDIDDFRVGLESFDFGAQNWAYADHEGNVAYFTSAEIPLRADLEAGVVAGLPPFFPRDGQSGANNWVPDPARSQGQSIPYAILPPSEMPEVINPPSGFFANANNDPAGLTLDNDPLNQRRLGNPDGIYYLGSGFAMGMRAGRITRLLRAKTEADEPISLADMRDFQTNVQQLDAELMVPHLLTAFANASDAGAPAELAALAGDADVAEAVGRLASWDFSTPTGIPEGWDRSDVLGTRLSTVPAEEVEASIAATTYNVWRGQAIRRIVNARLSELMVPGVGSTSGLKALHHLLSRTPYTGVGASGVDFIPEPAALTAEQRRDLALLGAMRAALDRLASNAFADAFGNSTDQDDYLWGRLHRIVFEHPIPDTVSGSVGDFTDFNLPPSGGFEDVSPQLPGLPRDGGYNVVNASGFGATGDDQNDFDFGGGPVRRYVGAAGLGPPDTRVVGYNVVPSIVDEPPNVSQMLFWLTGDYHVVRMREPGVQRGAVRAEQFVPLED